MMNTSGCEEVYNFVRSRPNGVAMDDIQGRISYIYPIDVVTQLCANGILTKRNCVYITTANAERNFRKLMNSN